MSAISPQDRRISQWLLVCLSLIFVMVILGGVTRLTGSGLSMVNWHPIHGVVPPFTSAQWLEEFGRYQQSPEYLKINRDMKVGEFKSIFWFEYAHRMLGRLIGLVFLLPFLYFWWQNSIKPGLTPKLIIIFFLGGLQGLLGWYMLLSAILIYAFILWTILDLKQGQQDRSDDPSVVSAWRKVSLGLLILVLLTIVSGGFVAGLDAGVIYNTFPLMGGEWVPEGVSALSPWYLNLFENKVLLGWYIRGRFQFENPVLKRSFKLVGMMVVIQVLLGVSTLLMQVPVWLAAMHQAGALLLLSAMLINLHALRQF
jgi:cytochrome c oxidase assembly protein subunit 15